MSAPRNGERIYICPTHKGVQQPGPGKCPLCGKALRPEDGRYTQLLQLLANPLPLLVMVAITIVLTIAAMMVR